MKYLALIVVSAFAGFVGAWWLFQATTNDALPASAAPRSASHGPAAPVPQIDSAPDFAAQREGNALDFDAIERNPSIFNKLYIAWQLAARADIPHLKSLIDKCLAHDDSLYTMNIATVFMERFIALDPRAAMDFVVHEPRLDQTFFQTDVITSWVRYDARAAVDYFKGISNQEIRLATGSRLLDDPAVKQAGLVDEVKKALGPWADRIAEQVQMRKTDPSRLFDEALQEQGRDRVTHLNNAVSRWVMRDPTAALDRILALDNPAERNSMIQLAISVYARMDPDAALEWLRTKRPSDTGLQRQVIAGLASQDINKALPLVEDYVRRTGSSRIWDTIVRSWASQDPQAAIAYVENLSMDDKTGLYRSLALAYVSSHPNEGLRWVARLGPGYNSVKASALSQVDARNIQTAEQLLSQSADNVTRGSLIGGIARYKSISDPAAALDWLDNYRGDKAWSSAYQEVMQTYAQRDPAAAARRLDASANGDTMSGPAATIAYAWYRKDPDAAVSWATNLPPSASRNGAVAALARSIAPTDLDRAVNLLDSLPHAIQRDIATAIGYSWVNRHPDRVEEAISKLDLGPALANQLRQAAGGGG